MVYSKIKKEHLFIFLAIFTLLVLLTYFEVDYTGLTTKGVCKLEGYDCCDVNKGEGVYHFSLDETCSENEECWDSCIIETNQITGGSFWSSIGDWWSSIFGKEVVGVETGEYCRDSEEGCPKGTIFTTSDIWMTDGDFGGIEGADAICTAAAQSAGLRGTWRALIGTYNNALQNRLRGWGEDSLLSGQNIKFRNINNQIVAEGYAHFMGDGNNEPLDAALNYDEHGNKYGEVETFNDGLDKDEDGKIDCEVWSGKTNDERTRSYYCRYYPNDWVNVDTQNPQGSVGSCTGRNSQEWYGEDNTRDCDEKYRLYCIKTSNLDVGKYLEINKESLSFSTQIGDEEINNFKIKNTGTETLTITNIKTNNRNYSPQNNGEVITKIKIGSRVLEPSGYTYSLGGDIKLDPNQELNIEVTCKLKNSHPTPSTGNIEIHSDAIVSPQKISYECDEEGSSNIQTSTDELIINTPKDIAKTGSFTVSNTGDADLVITNIRTNSRKYEIRPNGVDEGIEVITQIKTIDSNMPSNDKTSYPNQNTQSYSTEPFRNSIVIPSGDGFTIQLTCKPNSAESHEGDVVITFNGGTKRVHYICNGVGEEEGSSNIQTSTDELIINTPKDIAKTGSFTVSNTGDADLIISNINLNSRNYIYGNGNIEGVIEVIKSIRIGDSTLSPNNNYPYSYNLPGSITLTPNEKITVTLNCQPNSAESHEGDVVITFNGGTKRVHYICNGEGTETSTRLAKPKNLIGNQNENAIILTWDYYEDGRNLCNFYPTTGGAVVNQITGNTIGDWFSNLWSSIFGKEVGARQRNTGTSRGSISFILNRDEIGGNNDENFNINIANGCDYTDTITSSGRYKYKVKAMKDTASSLWSDSTETFLVDLEDEGGDDDYYGPENCDEDNNDEDGDGIKSIFDTDCDEDYSSFIALKEGGLEVSNDEPYIGSKIIVDCTYNVFDSEGELKTRTTNIIDNSLDCIELDIDCDEKIDTAMTGYYNAKFIDCDVGDEEEEKTITCSINENCNKEAFDATNYRLELTSETIEVKEFEYCEDGNQGSSLILEVDTNDNDYQTGEIIEITVEVQSFENRESIIVEAALIDLNNGNKIKEVESTEKIIEYRESEEFELNLAIPSFNTQNYKLYVKTYVKGQEEDICQQKSIELDIENEDETGDECIIDNDCYDNEECINGYCELITIDESCEEGDTQYCSTGLLGICEEGVQVCTEEIWEECLQSKRARDSEVCNNNLDDNCNGVVDEGCGDEGTSSDSDGDGLLDSWELQFFGNLLQGPDGDYDGDGISNIDEYRENTDPTNKSDGLKGGSLTWLWIIIGIIIVVVIIFFVFKFLTKPKRGGISSSRTSSPADPRLKAYIQSSLSKGFTKHQIKQALLTKGWNQKDIDKALR